MALSANADYVVKDDWGLPSFSAIVLDAAVIFNGSLVTHDTTAGEVKVFDGTEADRFLGMHFGDAVTGNASGARNRAQIKPGGFSIRVLVTGVNDDATDYGLLVYAVDDGTYSLTSTGNKLIGKVLPEDRRSAGEAQVWLFPIVDGVIDSAAT